MGRVSVVILSQYQARMRAWRTKLPPQSGGIAESGLKRLIFNANLTEAVMRMIYLSFHPVAMGH